MRNLYNLVLKDSPLDCPFAPNFKNSLGTAAAMSLPALFSTFIASKNSEDNNNRNIRLQQQTNELGAELQRETNQLNADLTRETNMQNQAMFDKSLSWQNEMWQKTNEYNDPKNVVQRMLNAGINPSVGLSQGGVASSMGSPSAPSMQSARMEAFKPVAPQGDINAGMFNLDGALQGAVNAFNQSRLADQSIKESRSRTHGNDLNNEFSAKTLADRVKQLFHLAKIDEANEEFYKNQARFSTATFDARQALELGNVELQQKHLALAEKSVINMQLDIDAKQIENAWLPVLKEDEHKQYLQTLASAKAQVGLILANTTLTYKQAETEIQKKVGTILDNGLKGISYEVQDGTKKDVMSMVHEQLIEKYNTNRFTTIGGLMTEKRTNPFNKYLTPQW